MTIGGAPGFQNTTAVGLGWGLAGFEQVDIPSGASWQNSVTGNQQGESMLIDARNLMGESQYTGLGTLAMRLVIEESMVGSDGLAFSFAGRIIYHPGFLDGPFFSTVDFTQQLWAVPSPPVIAVLAALAVPRRRRRSA